jgi:hypothetical protein
MDRGPKRGEVSLFQRMPKSTPMRLLGKYFLRPPKTKDLRGETSLFFRGGVRGELSPKSMLVVFLKSLTFAETLKNLCLILLSMTIH